MATKETMHPRVLHVIDTLALGGAQSLLRDLFEFQKDNGNIFLFACRQTELTVEIDHPNILFSRSNGKWSFNPMMEIRQLVKSKNIEIIHCHLLKSQIMSWLVKKTLPKVKLVWHEHGQVIGTENESKFEALLFKFFVGASRKSFNKYICITEYVRNTLIKEFKVSPEKAVVVYNGIRTDSFEKNELKGSILRKNQNVPDDIVLIGFAARLVQRKGWRLFLEAAKAFKGNSKMHFFIAGEGNDSEEVKKYVRSNDLENISLLGYVRDMLAFYSAIDVFVICPIWEPMGLTQLEAQSAGVPVIASYVDGLNETLANENALFINPNEPVELVDAIKTLFTADVRDKLSQEGKRNATKFSISIFSKNLESNYRDLE